MKSVFKVFLAIHMFLYRLTKGRIGGSMGNTGVLLLTTTGRKTGKERTVPLGYIIDKDDYVIIASNGGQDKHPAWFFNIESNPKVGLQVNDRVMEATATTADPDARKRLWAQLLTVAPNYGNYEKSTSREIPLVILHPVR